MLSEPLVSAWIVAPLAAGSLVLIWAHLAALQRVTEMPESRRRIRTVSGLVAALGVGVLALGFGVVSPSDAKPFALVWLAAMGLIFIMVVLAAADVVNTLRLELIERRVKLRRSRQVRAEWLAVLMARRMAGSSSVDITPPSHA